jgi:hypothetical protein
MAYHSGETIYTKVVGVTFDGRQSVIKQLAAGEHLLLKREPYNRYDPNAIQVERLNGAQLGYLSKDLVRELAPFFDKVGGTANATVKELVGDYGRGYNLGVRIAFSVPSAENSRSESIIGGSEPTGKATSEYKKNARLKENGFKSKTPAVAAVAATGILVAVGANIVIASASVLGIYKIIQWGKRNFK